MLVGRQGDTRRKAGPSWRQPVRCWLGAVAIAAHLYDPAHAEQERLAIIADSAANRVFVVDLAFGSVVKSIPVGEASLTGDVALAPDGRTAFAASAFPGAVYAIDTHTDAVQMAAAPGGPLQLVITPDGRSLYVGLFSAHAVLEIDTSRLDIKRNIPVDPGPVALALSPDGNTLYLTHFRRDYVSIVDLQTGQIRARVPAGNDLYGLATAADGRSVYVGLQRVSDNLKILDALTLDVVSLSVPGSLFEIALSPRDTLLFAANPGLSVVSVIDPRSGEVLASPEVEGSPLGVAVGSQGRFVYATSDFFTGIPPAGVADGVVSVIDGTNFEVVGRVRRVGRSPVTIGLSSVDLPCGNALLDPGEECDDGNRLGGDGCALNCTVETERAFGLQPATSRLTLKTLDTDYTAGLTGTLLLRTGSPRTGGSIPVTVRASEVHFDPVAVEGVGCVCLRPAVPPDAGPLNAATGEIGCGEGAVLNAAYFAGRDHNAGGSDPTCETGTVEGPDRPHPGVCNGPDRFFFYADGLRGAGVIEAPLRFDVIADGGTCAVDSSEPANGPDGRPCTDDDPGAAGAVALRPLVTAAVLSRINGAGNNPFPAERTIAVYLTGQDFDCDALADAPTEGIGGVTLVSALPLLDTPLLGDVLVTLELVAFSDHPPTPTPTPTPTPVPCAGQCPPEQCVENVCVPPPPSCGGDCSGDGAVTIAELIVAVNQALEITPIGACPDADADRDGAVSMHELVAAVSHALEGCPGGGEAAQSILE